MARNGPRISDSEMRLMQLLWEESPLGATQLAERIGPESGWSLATVKTLLSRLMAKGAIEAESEGRRFRYRPAVEKETIAGRQAGKLIDRLFGGKVSPLVAHLVDQRSIDPEDLDELEALIRKLRK